MMLVMLIAMGNTFAQSKTTNQLEEKYKDSFKLFFYQNTLRMINQSGDATFDELINNIEKMKFLSIPKQKNDFNYNAIKKSYLKESFEEILTTRHDGNNVDVLVREKNDEVKGMLVLVNSDENLIVLDILGKIDLNNVGKFYTLLEENKDVSKKITQFMNDHDDK